MHVATYGHPESGLIFTTDSGSPLTTSTVHAAWQTAARMIVQATPHDYADLVVMPTSVRNPLQDFASVQIRAGQSIKVLQALLGHRSAVETWDAYGHIMGDEDDRSRSVIEDALGNSDHSTTTVSRT